jgi:hypothetical protein
VTELIDVQASRVFVLDLAERAGNAAWQGAAGAAGPILIAANATDIAHAAWWQQLLGVAAAGALSGVGSLIKGVRAGLKTGTASLSPTVAQTAVLPGAHATDSQLPPAAEADTSAADTALAAAAEAHPMVTDPAAVGAGASA